MALQELVDAKFVRTFDTHEDAVEYLNGERPATPKLAAVKTVKEGVTKYRLIIDCRVSGSNDAATRNERILLPQTAWAFLRDIMALRRD